MHGVLITVLFLWQAEAQGLLLDAVIQEQTYCQQKDGMRVLRLTLTPMYLNAGVENLIIPRICHVRAMSLRTRDKLVWQEKPVKLETYANSIWSTPKPDPGLFLQLRPGERSAGSPAMIVIPLQRQSSGKGLGPGTYSLRVTIDHGPHSERKLRVVPWKELGILAVGSIESTPAAVQVSPPQSFPLCVGPPVLRSTKSWP